MRFLKRHGPGRSCALTLALCLTWLGSDAQAGWYPGQLIKKWWSGGECES